MKRHFAASVAVLMVVAVGSARAQAPAELEPGVARVSLIHGEVSTRRGDSGDWVAATLNTPVVTGDHVSTGHNSRAEVQLDHGNILRLSNDAATKVANLTRTRIQIQVGQGLVNYSVLKASEADVEIDTPNVAILPRSQGSYRIWVNSDSETQVIVREGTAEVTTPQGSTKLEKGQLITIQGTDSPQYQTVSAPGNDDWDRFNSDRDHLISNAGSWRHTNHYYVGTEDLDAYGHWAYVPDYHDVWVPVQGPGWVPYRDGRWVWEPYYGWTWVSYEPWGWAPYHYGRWFVYGGNWCWWPGPVVAYPVYRPVWAPAYVSFLGFGGSHFSFGVSVGFGRVGWLPIGPADPFFPWYGRSVNRVNVVNVTSVTNIYNIHDRDGFRRVPPLVGFGARPFSNIDQAFTNVRVRQAVVSMPASQFGRARTPIHSEVIDASSFREGKLLTGAVPVMPTRESLRPTDRPVNPAAIPNRGTSQQFFSKSQPAPEPRPFSEQAAQVQHMTDAWRTNRAPMTQTSGAMGTTRTLQPSRTAGSQPAISPGRPFSPAGTAPFKTVTASRPNAPAEPQATQRPGWHTFGSRNQGSSIQGTEPLRQGNPTSEIRQNAPASPSSGWRTFGSSQQLAGPGRNDRVTQPAQPQGGNNPAPRTFAPATPRQNESAPAGRRGGGWQRFNAPMPQAQPESGGRNSGGSNGWQSFPSRSGPSRWGETQRQWQSPASRESSRSFSRPPLDLRQPIVTPRSSSSDGYSGQHGGYHGGSTGGHGSYSAPSHSSGERSSRERSR